MNCFDFIASAGLKEVLSVSQITTTERVTRTKQLLLLGIFEKRTYTEAFTTPTPGALSNAYGNPPSPSRSVELSDSPHVITLFRQHLVSLLLLSSKMSILK